MVLGLIFNLCLISGGQRGFYIIVCCLLIINIMTVDCFSVSSNPTPGVIINRPNGSDVYKGVLKDYIGDVSQCV